MTKGPEAYEVESVQCGACARRDKARTAFTKSPNADTDGVFWLVAPREETDG